MGDKAVRLINNPALTNDLQTLSHRRDVSCLCLFYRYYFGQCSDELAAITPKPRTFIRSTRNDCFSNPYQVTVLHTRTELYKQSFFPSTAMLWNRLPCDVFPSTMSLQSFKTSVNRLELDRLH